MSHKDKGRIGSIPAQTEIFKESDDPTLLSWGYAQSRENGKLDKLLHSHDDPMGNEHAKEFFNNMKEHGLNLDDIDSALINHTKNIDVPSLHNNAKPIPLEYTTKKPN